MAFNQDLLGGRQIDGRGDLEEEAVLETCCQILYMQNDLRVRVCGQRKGEKNRGRRGRRGCWDRQKTQKHGHNSVQPVECRE